MNLSTGICLNIARLLSEVKVTRKGQGQDINKAYSIMKTKMAYLLGPAPQELLLVERVKSVRHSVRACERASVRACVRTCVRPSVHNFFRPIPSKVGTLKRYIML